MSALRNPRHERFAQEIAKGKTLEEAHGLAGFRVNRGNAAVLKRNQSISNRVAEILAERERIEDKATERAVERTAITKERVLAMLIEDRSLAREKGQTAAAIRAAELLGKELGMFIDRRERGKPGEFDHLSTEELEQRLFDRLVASGVPERYARAVIEYEEPPRERASQPRWLKPSQPHH